MADIFTWNNPNSIEAIAIRNFLQRAAQRIEDAPQRLPIKVDQALLAISWLRALMDKKPSELAIEAVNETYDKG